MGLGLVAVGVGCLEFVLDKGQEKDWFGDHAITSTFVFAVACLVFFVWWEWRHQDPIVDVKLLKNRNFGTAVGFQFILGMVLFSTTVLIPQFLQGLIGYTAERAGMALSVGALVLMLMMPVAGRLVSRMDPRLMVSIGFLATALALYNMTRLDLNVAFGSIVMWRVYQVLGLSFIFIPISTLNYVGVPQGKNNQISSFSNFARNLGGSIGTALLTTFLVRTQQTHQMALAANIDPGSPAYENYLAQTKSALHGDRSRRDTGRQRRLWARLPAIAAAIVDAELQERIFCVELDGSGAGAISLYHAQAAQERQTAR